MPKRQKIYLTPRHWTGVFPGFVILSAMLFVGAVVYIAPFAYRMYTDANVNGYLMGIANAEGVYHAKTGEYTADTSKLRTNTGQPVNAAVGITGKIVSTCQGGYVAYAAAAVGQQGGKYVTNADPTPGTLEETVLPGCVTADELGKTTLGYKVTVSGIRVARSASVGARVEGTVSNSREGASVTWSAKDTCSEGQKPIYTVQFSDTNSGKVLNSASTTRNGISLSGIYNGLKYKVSVSGRCGSAYPAGKATTVGFVQAIPKSTGLLVRWIPGKQTMSLLFGTVSNTNQYLNYEIQYSNGGSWKTLTKDITGGVMAYRPDGFTPGYYTRFRIRGINGDVAGSWSDPRQVQFS